MDFHGFSLSYFFSSLEFSTKINIRYDGDIFCCIHASFNTLRCDDSLPLFIFTLKCLIYIPTYICTFSNVDTYIIIYIIYDLSMIVNVLWFRMCVYVCLLVRVCLRERYLRPRDIFSMFVGNRKLVDKPFGSRGGEQATDPYRIRI